MTQTIETSRRLAREAYVNGYLTFDELDRVSRMIDAVDLAGIRDLLLVAAARHYGWHVADVETHDEDGGTNGTPLPGYLR